MAADEKKKVVLGQRVMDKITGFTGHATVRVESFTGSTRIGVEALDDQNNARVEYFDEVRIDVIDEEIVEL
jgi:hypothetical protein